MQIRPLGSGHSADSLLVLLREEDCKNLTPFDGELAGILSVLISRRDFTGKKDSLLRVPMVEGCLYVVGLGKTEKCSLSVIREALVQGLRKIGTSRGKIADVIVSHLAEYDGLSFVLGEAGGLCGYFPQTLHKSLTNNA